MNEDAKKIAFISCVNDEEMYAECVRYLRHLDMPQGFSAEVVPVRGAPSMAAGYEAARRASSALYKVYMHQDIGGRRMVGIERVLRLSLACSPSGSDGIDAEASCASSRR